MEGVYFTEIFWELYSVILVEELPNRNCFGINLVIILCAMVFVCQSKLTEFFAELTEFAVKLSEAQ